MTRRPTPTRHAAGIPTLGALLAAGAHLAGCHAPGCEESRARELETHGHEAVEQLRAGHTAESLRMLRIATGLTIHPARPVPLELPQDVDGGIRAVDPTPVPPPIEVPPNPRPTDVDGGLRSTTTVPPQPRPSPPPPVTPPTPHRPRRPGPAAPAPVPYESHMLGDIGAVQAVPPSQQTRRPA